MRIEGHPTHPRIRGQKPLKRRKVVPPVVKEMYIDTNLATGP